MAKSLGQIHTVNYELDHLTYPLTAGNKMLIDLPGELTSQLQHMVRAMSSFKVVGIDLSYGPIINEIGTQCTMTGALKYYAPTAGRCEALKMAYNAVRRMMKLSGVKPTDTINYDFRPPLFDPADAENGANFKNQASIEDNGLASCLANGPAGSNNIFGVYNQGINPRATGGVVGFEEGFDIGLRTNAASADWVLEEGIYLRSLTAPYADEEMESIPFELGYSSAVSDSGVVTDGNFEWRPDPALYLSVLTGQFMIDIETSSAIDAAGNPDMDGTQLDVAVHVAGWKGILGDHKKRRHSKKGGKKHGRRRTSKR